MQKNNFFLINFFLPACQSPVEGIKTPVNVTAKAIRSSVNSKDPESMANTKKKKAFFSFVKNAQKAKIFTNLHQNCINQLHQNY